MLFPFRGKVRTYFFIKYVLFFSRVSRYTGENSRKSVLKERSPRLRGIDAFCLEGNGPGEESNT